MRRQGRCEDAGPRASEPLVRPGKDRRRSIAVYHGFGEADTVKLRQGGVKQRHDFVDMGIRLAIREYLLSKRRQAQKGGCCGSQEAQYASAGSAEEEAMAKALTEDDNFVFVPISDDQLKIVRNAPGFG